MPYGVMVTAIAAGAAAVTAAYTGYRYTRVKREMKQVEMLLGAALHVNSTLEKRALLDIIMKTASEVVNAEASSVLLVDPATEELYFELVIGENGESVREIRLKPGEGLAGAVATSGEAIIVNDPAGDPRWSSRVSDRSGVATRNLLCVPIVYRGYVTGVLQALNKKSGSFTERDKQLLSRVAAPVAVALENAQLYEALTHSIDVLKSTTADKDRMESELRIAGDIQLSFLPREPVPSRMDCGVSAVLLPAKQAGGDFYNYMALTDELLFFTLGDVSDKGVPAALFMAATITLLKGAVFPGMTPAELLSRVNDTLCKDEPAMFATVVCGMLNTVTGELVLSEGGHCPPYLMKKDGSIEALKLPKGMPLGSWPEANYRDMTLQLLPGDRLLLYSDGIIEAENKAGELYGAKRLVDYLAGYGAGSINEVSSGLLQDVVAYADGAPQSDDIAILCVARKEA